PHWPWSGALTPARQASATTTLLVTPTISACSVHLGNPGLSGQLVLREGAHPVRVAPPKQKIAAYWQMGLVYLRPRIHRLASAWWTVRSIYSFRTFAPNAVCLVRRLKPTRAICTTIFGISPSAGSRNRPPSAASTFWRT